MNAIIPRKEKTPITTSVKLSEVDIFLKPNQGRKQSDDLAGCRNFATSFHFKYV